MPTLPPGLYDLLITRDVDAALAALAEALRHDRRPLDPETAPLMLARLIHDAAHKALASQRGASREERLGAQVELGNALLAFLRARAEHAGISEDDAVAERAERLVALWPPPQGLGADAPPERPGVPLRSSDLLVNGPRDLRVGNELRRELASADRVDVLLSFLKWSGLRLLGDAIEAFLARRPGGLRLITTAYLGATEQRALEWLVARGAEVRVSYDTRQTRLHAKAWLFHRASGFHTAYIGSSNLSAAALVDGLEWNVRLSVVDNRAVLRKFETTFAQYWGDGDFQPFDPDAFAAAVYDPARDATPLPSVQVRPYPHQVEILEALATERAEGHRHNLVVAATGTGKTVVAALDYARLRAEHGPLSLLFVAHRREILDQARATYRAVLRDGAFGERLVDGDRPRAGQHVFAAVQSLHAERLATVAPDAYDVIVIDEFHHAAAPTYRALLNHLRPRWLLGLTATPERTDGVDILGAFDHRVAAEIRLWDALDRNLLVPFQYFGVSDGTDLSRLRWARGRYVDAELSHVYTGDDLRLGHVIEAINRVVTAPRHMRALGFCVGVAHAEYMALRFNQRGIPAAAVHGETPGITRQDALRRLAAGELAVIFTVDLFNEGVDVPSVDTVLFLRPTESATVFLQQLGRGLRHAPGKSCLTVLDFIGGAHREFRYDLRFRALLGGGRQAVRAQIEHGFPHLPPGCAITLDRQAREAVLDNLSQSLRIDRRSLSDELRRLGDVPLATFLRETGIDLADLYRGGRTFGDLRRAAGFPSRGDGPQSVALGRALGRWIHVDDIERLRTWRRWLAAPAPPAIADPDSREGRLQCMLFAALGHAQRPLAELGDAFAELWDHGEIRHEAIALLDVLADGLRHLTHALPGDDPAPVRVHGSYRLDEIMAAFGVARSGRIYRPRGSGVWYEAADDTDLLFVTLEKSADEYSPTTMYEDHPLSPTEFHWESQSTTSATSPTGRRYVGGGGRVLLFARRTRKDERGETCAYLLLGTAKCARHEGERPMRIVWRLDRPMPPAWYAEVKIAPS